jgi:hypothetical protein
MIDPSHRYKAALHKVAKDPKACLKSKCPLEKRLAERELGHPIVSDALNRALEIYEGKRNSKIIMESLLFCQEKLEELIRKIVVHMNIAEAVPVYYSTYFFDPEVFEDTFDRLDYIEWLSEDNSPAGIKEKISKQLALTEGFSYVLSHFKGGSIDYSATEYTKKLLAIANKYVAQAQNTGILSKESDKLYKWMQLGQKLAITLKALKEDSVDDALQDIRIALEYDAPPDKIDVLPPDDVLRG